MRRLAKVLAWTVGVTAALIAVDALDQRWRKGWWAARKIRREMERYQAAELAKWQGVIPWDWRARRPGYHHPTAAHTVGTSDGPTAA